MRNALPNLNPSLTPLAGGAAGIRQFVLFCEYFPIFR
jgi:hypothetical protein